MSRLRLLAAAGVLAAASVSVLAPAMAQERSSPTRPPSGGQVPSGSYLQTCRGANMNGNMLSAQCTGPTGAPVFSSIDTNGCRGRDIANDRGYLRCNSGGGPRPPEPPRPEPPRPVPPRPIPPRPIPPRPEPPRPEPPRPPAPGNFSVTVYTGANYTGRSMSIRTAVANFGNFPGFNDNIRSIRVHSGRVQACADSRYNGRCVTIGQSYRDLNAIRMANQISSIR
jgi:hypothetical protein